MSMRSTANAASARSFSSATVSRHGADVDEVLVAGGHRGEVSHGLSVGDAFPAVLAGPVPAGFAGRLSHGQPRRTGWPHAWQSGWLVKPAGSATVPAMGLCRSQAWTGLPCQAPYQTVDAGDAQPSVSHISRTPRSLRIMTSMVSPLRLSPFTGMRYQPHSKTSSAGMAPGRRDVASGRLRDKRGTDGRCGRCGATPRAASPAR